MISDYEDYVLEDRRDRDYERKSLERKVGNSKVVVDAVGDGEDERV